MFTDVRQRQNSRFFQLGKTSIIPACGIMIVYATIFLYIDAYFKHEEEMKYTYLKIMMLIIRAWNKLLKIITGPVPVSSL